MLDVRNLTIANGNAIVGGGIYNEGGTVTVTNSTFSGNSAGQGGGISNDGTVTIANTIIAAWTTPWAAAWSDLCAVCR